jgi:phage host-nuclease inhibitor protein Gam
MRNKPVNLIPVNDLDDAKKILQSIAGLQRDVKELQLDAEAQIDEIKARLGRNIQSALEEIKKSELSLSAFANSHKQDIFKDRKTVDLTFGYMGFRLSTKISVSKQTLKLLKQMKYTDAIITKESVNKDVLAQYPADKLAEVKAKKVVDDNFWYEIKEETKTK